MTQKSYKANLQQLFFFIKGAKRALLRMDCPFQTVGGNCYNEEKINWKCAKCKKDVEYWMDEQMIMCNKCKFMIDPGQAEFLCAGQQCMGFDTFGNGLCLARKVKRKVNKSFVSIYEN